MLCIFALLMTMSYYFGKKEATLNIKEKKINKIKDVVSNNPNIQPYLLHFQIGKYKLAAW